MESTELAYHAISYKLKEATRPMTNRQLIAELRLEISEPEVREVIHELRKHLPILADSRGYWIARSVAEIMDYCGRLKHRIKEQEETLRNLSRHVVRQQATLEL